MQSMKKKMCGILKIEKRMYVSYSKKSKKK